MATTQFAPNLELGPSVDWFALRTSIHSERSAANLLERKGYEVMVPLRSKDGRARNPVALFPGYIFCQLDPNYPLPALKTPGVHALVGYGRQPARLTPDDVNVIRALTQTAIPADPWPHLCVGQAVRITQGPLTGLNGVLSQVHSGLQVALTVELLSRSVLLQIPLDHVTPC
jgi:transcriptional antiterminator NusG